MFTGTGGSAPKPLRFNALGPYGWRENKDRAITLGLHPYGIHHGAQVAPQRCPILRMSAGRLLIQPYFCNRKKKILKNILCNISELRPEL
jgi:hypothetical protein